MITTDELRAHLLADEDLAGEGSWAAGGGGAELIKPANLSSVRALNSRSGALCHSLLGRNTLYCQYMFIII